MDLSNAKWRKSTYSGSDGGTCVEVTSNLPDIVAIRDSKNRSGPALVFAPGAWTEFLRGVKNAEFNRA